MCGIVYIYAWGLSLGIIWMNDNAAKHCKGLCWVDQKVHLGFS